MKRVSDYLASLGFKELAIIALRTKNPTVKLNLVALALSKINNKPTDSTTSWRTI